MNLPELRHYQERAINFGLRIPLHYFAMDMGLGKTRIAIELQSLYNVCAIVIAPLKGTQSTWPDEIQKWRPEKTFNVLHGSEKSLKGPVKDFYVINFDGLKWLHETCMQLMKSKIRIPFKYLIIDEGSMVKNHVTNRFKILKAFAPIFSKISILSGTPSPNSLHDLWTQYYLLDKGQRLGKNISAYRNRYFVPARLGYKFTCRDEFTGTTECADEIHQLVSDITFRLDADDYLELPDIVEIPVKVDLPSEVKGMLKTLKNDKIIKINDAVIAAKNMASELMFARQIVQGGLYKAKKPDYYELHRVKLDALKSIVDEAQGQNILCAINFKFELDMLKKEFPNAPVIAGGTSTNEFTQILKDWNAGKIPICFCHPAALSHSVNMQFGGNILVWYAQTFSNEQDIQLTYRLRRIGQSKTVFVYRIMAVGTIDSVIVRAVVKKQNIQKALLDYLKGVTDEQYMG
jgi:SNF2 family DNA or RNA helicase